jgi:hypothetical protein
MSPRFALLPLLCLLPQVGHAEDAGVNVKKDLAELYESVDARRVKIQTILPPWIKLSKTQDSSVTEHQGCPEQINIASVQSKNAIIGSFHPEVRIDAPIVIRCR